MIRLRHMATLALFTFMSCSVADRNLPESLKQELNRIFAQNDWKAIESMSADQILDVALGVPGSNFGQNKPADHPFDRAIAVALSRQDNVPQSVAVLTQIFDVYCWSHDNDARARSAGYWWRNANSAIWILYWATKEWNSGEALSARRKLAAKIAALVEHRTPWTAAHAADKAARMDPDETIKALGSRRSRVRTLWGDADLRKNGPTLSVAMFDLLCRFGEEIPLADVQSFVADTQSNREAVIAAIRHLRSRTDKIPPRDLILWSAGHLKFGDLATAWVEAGGCDAKLVESLLQDASADARRAGLQLTLWPQTQGSPDEGKQKLAEQFLSDSDPGVQTVACTFLEMWSLAESVQLLVRRELRTAAGDLSRVMTLWRAIEWAQWDDRSQELKARESLKRWHALAKDPCLDFLRMAITSNQEDAFPALELLQVEVESVSEALDAHMTKYAGPWVPRLMVRLPGKVDAKVKLLLPRIRSGNDSLRREAMLGIAQLDPATMAGEQEKFLADANVPSRLEFLRILPRIKPDDQSQAALVARWVGDPEPRVREELVKVLDQLDAPVLGGLAQAIAKDPSEEFRLTYFRLAHGKSGEAERLPLLQRWLEDRGGAVRREFMKVLDQVGPSTLAALSDPLARDPDPELRALYFRLARARFESSEQSKLLDQWLQDPAFRVRLDLVGILRELEPELMAAKAELFLRDGNELVRSRFFGELNGARLTRGAKVALCRKGISDSNAAVVAQAILALGKSGTKAEAKEVEPFLKSGEILQRAAALQALGALKIAEHEGAMVQALDDEDSRLRAAALRGLGLLGAKGQVEVIEKYLSDPAADTRAAAADALRSLRHPLRTQDIFRLLAPSVVHFTSKSGGTGSGFIVDPKGIVMTNRHVIEDKQGNVEEMTIRLHRDPKAYACRFLRRHPELDLALVQIVDPPKALSALEFADARPEVGDEIIIIGHPKGLNWTLTEGKVSQLRTLPRWGDVLQTDAAVNPGNSGGPMVNRFGQLLGVVTFILNESEGLNFGLSGNAARAFLHQD